MGLQTCWHSGATISYNSTLLHYSTINWIDQRKLHIRQNGDTKFQKEENKENQTSSIVNYMNDKSVASISLKPIFCNR